MILHIFFYLKFWKSRLSGTETSFLWSSLVKHNHRRKGEIACKGSNSGWYCGVVVSSVAQQQEGSGFDPGADWWLFCPEFVCSPHACTGFLEQVSAERPKKTKLWVHARSTLSFVKRKTKLNNKSRTPYWRHLYVHQQSLNLSTHTESSPQDVDQR